MPSQFYGTVPVSTGATTAWPLPLALTIVSAGAVGYLLLTSAHVTTLVTAAKPVTRTTPAMYGNAPTLQRAQPYALSHTSQANDKALYSSLEASETVVSGTRPVLGWTLLTGCVGALAGAILSLFTTTQRKTSKTSMAMMMASGARDYAGDMQKLSPLRDLVLAKVAAAEVKTTGGLVLPEVMQTKPTSGDVIAVGPKATALKAGECILYSKFGVAVTELDIAGQSHILIREADIIGVMPRSPANSKDVPELRPLLDKVLVRKDIEAKNQPSGLILQTEDSDAKYVTGEVVAVGGGYTDANGKFQAVTVQPGQRVVFSKYAGDKLPTPEGPEYVCLAESELLGVL